MLMRLNTAWKCICRILLRYLKGEYFSETTSFPPFPHFYSKVSFLNALCSFPVKIVPILVGALSERTEAMYGKLLAKYVDDPSNFFSVSSDFCHWGTR